MNGIRLSIGQFAGRAELFHELIEREAGIGREALEQFDLRVIQSRFLANRASGFDIGDASLHFFKHFTRRLVNLLRLAGRIQFQLHLRGGP